MSTNLEYETPVDRLVREFKEEFREEHNVGYDKQSPREDNQIPHSSPGLLSEGDKMGVASEDCVCHEYEGGEEE